MIKVCINGFGTVGKRIGCWLFLHPEVKLIGVSKFTPDADARFANMQKFPLFVKQEKRKDFEDKGMEVAGTLESMFEEADVVIDASDKWGAENKKTYYDPMGKIATLQGGEKHESTGFSFNSRANFEQAEGKRCARVVSCGTTALLRTLIPLSENYGIKNIMVQILRRAADPADDRSGPINSVNWKMNSHHGADVKTVHPLPIVTNAFKIPHTHMHVHLITVEFNGKVPKKEDYYELYRKEGRVALIEEASSTSEMMERMRDLGFERNDSYLAHLHINTYSPVNGGTSFVVTVPQESIVVPENIDAVFALMGGYEKNKTMEQTDKVMGIAKKREMLERIFSNKKKADKQESEPLKEKKVKTQTITK